MARHVRCATFGTAGVNVDARKRKLPKNIGGRKRIASGYVARAQSPSGGRTTPTGAIRIRTPSCYPAKKI